MSGPGSGGGGQLTITHVGNATVLLQIGSFTVLTDPNFLHRGQYAYLGYGLVTKRLLEPALRVDQLPPLDLVVLSHVHGDHWDRVARRGLARDVPIWTTPASARALHRQGFGQADGLRTWESRTLQRGAETLTLTATPGAHGLGPVRRLLPPVMGSVLQHRPAPGAPAGSLLYLSGDTMPIPALAEIPRRFPGLDVGVLHLGGTRLPGGLVVTMTAEQGADLVEQLGARTAIPVHTDDYSVMTSGSADFVEVVRRRGLTDRVTVLERGVATVVPG